MMSLLAFEVLQTNRTDTKPYREEFGNILRREKVHDEDHNGPDKNTRSLLLKMMEHKAEVIAWHSALQMAERRAWNHPSSVWRHFEKAHTAPKPAKPPKASPTTGLSPAEEAEHVENAQIAALPEEGREERAKGISERRRLGNGLADPMLSELALVRSCSKSGGNVPRGRICAGSGHPTARRLNTDFDPKLPFSMTQKSFATGRD